MLNNTHPTISLSLGIIASFVPLALLVYVSEHEGFSAISMFLWAAIAPAVITSYIVEKNVYFKSKILPHDDSDQRIRVACRERLDNDFKHILLWTTGAFIVVSIGILIAASSFMLIMYLIFGADAESFRFRWVIYEISSEISKNLINNPGGVFAFIFVALLCTLWVSMPFFALALYIRSARKAKAFGIIGRHYYISILCMLFLSIILSGVLLGVIERSTWKDFSGLYSVEGLSTAAIICPPILVFGAYINRYYLFILLSAEDSSGADPKNLGITRAD